MPHMFLQTHIAPEIRPLIESWLSDYSVSVNLKSNRRSKHGDFRPPHRGDAAQITINSGLNPFQFLLTITHEIAHLMVWHDFGPRVAPHGKEWKLCFGRLLRQLALQESLPQSFRQALMIHAKRPFASSSRDLNLMGVLRALNNDDDSLLLDVNVGETFRFRDEPFIKVKDNRTRCICRHIGTQALYYISKSARVDR